MIRQCETGDVSRLEEEMPTRGTAAHAALFARQETGELTYLVALHAGRPVGSCAVNWTGLRTEGLRAALPRCPELSNLFVVPAVRGMGTGTALVADGESRAFERGYSKLAIGVGEDNPRAAQLYERLGYRDVGLRWTARYNYPDTTGVLCEVIEPTIVLVKDLPDPH